MTAQQWYRFTLVARLAMGFLTGVMLGLTIVCGVHVGHAVLRVAGGDVAWSDLLDVATFLYSAGMTAIGVWMIREMTRELHKTKRRIERMQNSWW